jgi:hypothetical protein
MSIVFYSMGSRCGFCVKAESLLEPQIKSGKIVKKPASEANGKFNGFPAFVSEKTGKTHMGLPKSYDQLAKKLGHTEHYHSDNPYNYNAMPMMRVGAQDEPPEYKGQCQNISDMSKFRNCCSESCNNILQSACYLECEESLRPSTCNPPPQGMPASECCDLGGRSGAIGQCPDGCVDTAGECVPSGGSGSRTCGSFPGCPKGEGGIILDSGECECGIGGQSFRTLAECCKSTSGQALDLCDEFNCQRGSEPLPPPPSPPSPPSPKVKQCSKEDDCDDSQYCSISTKTCKDNPKTWTSDLYNSLVNEMVNDGLSKDQAKCLINGIASSSGCNFSPQDQQAANSDKMPACFTDKVVKMCNENANVFNNPVKASNNDSKDKKKKVSNLEIALIVIAVVGLLSLVGFLAYRAKK